MKNLKKLVALTLVMLMLLAGCGQTANNGNGGDDELTTVTVMMWDRGHEYTNGKTVTNNLYTDWLNELMEPQGVHLEFIAVSVAFVFYCRFHSIRQCVSVHAQCVCQMQVITVGPQTS